MNIKDGDMFYMHLIATDCDRPPCLFEHLQKAR
jgi:hypothetical protein